MSHDPEWALRCLDCGVCAEFSRTPPAVLEGFWHERHALTNLLFSFVGADIEVRINGALFRNADIRWADEHHDHRVIVWRQG